MERNKVEKKEDNRRIDRYRDEGSAAATAWKIVGGTVLALAIVTVVVTLPDLKRYIKISTM